MVNISAIKKPVNWFALQANWLGYVSWEHCTYFYFYSFRGPIWISPEVASATTQQIWEALWDLVPFVQFEKREKYLWRSAFYVFWTNGTKSRNATHIYWVLLTSEGISPVNSFQLSHLFFRTDKWLVSIGNSALGW